jgi:hypothetical protein
MADDTDRKLAAICEQLRSEIQDAKKALLAEVKKLEERVADLEN